PGVKFCAGEGGLRSWEWCGCGGVEGKTRESGVKGMAGKPAGYQNFISASLLVALNLNLRAYVNSIPSGLVINSVVDVFSLNIIVGGPNGTLATISHIDNLKLTNNIVSYDLLVVPGYCDKTRQRTLGTSSESGVLATLHNDPNISKFAFVPMCEVCHRAKQTREPFPLSEHKSKNLRCKWLFKIKYKASCDIESDLIEDVYMTLPQGFNNDNGTKSKFDYSLYVKRDGYVFVALLVYVEDIVITDAVDSEEKYVWFVDGDTLPQHKFAHTVPAIAKLLQHLKVIGCSQGLLCMHGHFVNNSGRKNMAVLWNINDPMIIKFTYVDPYLQWQNKVSLPWQVHVFTLSSGSWKSLSKNLPCGTMTINPYQVVIDSFIYWVAYDDLTTDGEGQAQLNSFIISFDMTTKESKVVDLFDTLKSSILSISKLGESLALVQHERINKKHICVVRMMEDLVTKSFTKHFTFSTHHAMTRTLGFRKNGELISEYRAEEDIIHERQAGLVGYEPWSELINDLLLCGRIYSFFVSSYEETLVLLDQVDCSILETFIR
nr:hypothetical protein [Tanacetum cinerariifolium]